MLDSRPTIHPTCDTHPEIPASRVVEYRIPDPLSTRHDEYLDTRHLFICASDACEVSAQAAARMDGADPRTVATYPLTPSDADAILGAVA